MVGGVGGRLARGSTGAESLSIGVGEAGETGGNEAVLAGEIGDNCSSSSTSLSHSSSASHLRLEAFVSAWPAVRHLLLGRDHLAL
jgi:hypothetical protein